MTTPSTLPFLNLFEGDLGDASLRRRPGRPGPPAGCAKVPRGPFSLPGRMGFASEECISTPAVPTLDDGGLKDLLVPVTGVNNEGHGRKGAPPLDRPVSLTAPTTSQTLITQPVTAAATMAPSRPKAAAPPPQERRGRPPSSGWNPLWNSNEVRRIPGRWRRS